MGLRGDAHNINAPGTVVDVNGRSGNVVLTPADVGITAAVTNGVLYYDGANFVNDANNTWDPVAKKLAIGAGGEIDVPTLAASTLITTPVIRIGASAFPFLESSPGVLQLGDVTMNWVQSQSSLTLAQGFFVSITSDDGAGNSDRTSLGPNSLFNAQFGTAIAPTSFSVGIQQGTPAAGSTVGIINGGTGWELGSSADTNPNVFYPDIANAFDLGQVGNEVRTGYLNHVLGAEVATPSAPADGSGILYFKDAGAGKTGLYVLFPSGAEQQIKVEA